MEEDIEMEEDNEPSSAADFNIFWGSLRVASSFVKDIEKECHRNQISIDEISIIAVDNQTLIRDIDFQLYSSSTSG